MCPVVGLVVGPVVDGATTPPPPPLHPPPPQVDTGGEPHEVKDLTVSNLRKQVGETDSLLGRHLKLYQIHSATLEVCLYPAHLHAKLP